MLVGLPVALDYVVRPGDTLSEIAEQHDVTVTRIVRRNDLPASGDQVIAGQTLRIPSAGRRTGAGRPPRAGHRRPGSTRRIGPDARRIVRYTVRPGDTPSGLAVRFHAWTAELIALNGSVLRVGERIRIPVVLAAVANDTKKKKQATKAKKRTKTKHDTTSPGKKSAGKKSAGKNKKRSGHKKRKARRARGHRADPSRATVRRVIARTARRHGVDPQLALAVSWQESGWQMHRDSSAGAIGAMQVMPGTGEWMSQVAGRRLRLRKLHDNAVAGVVLLKLLRQQASLRMALAGYYQGLAGVRRHGMYSDTRRYVANVRAIRRRFEQGHYPA